MVAKEEYIEQTALKQRQCSEISQLFSTQL